MKVGIIFVYMDYNRNGLHNRGVLQPQIGPLIAGLLPRHVEVEVVNDTWEEPDWNKDYDLLFISSLHSDFDRARQISHYWRRRGAKTVFGGTMASTYASLCKPFFDAIIVGDAEGSVRQVYEDFSRGKLQSVYVSGAYDQASVPVPRFDLLVGKQRFPLALEATRGCPFSCEFCALTGLGTRHHTRPTELIVRDIREGQRMLRGLVPWHKRRMVLFCDNNIGGNLSYLSELCEALNPLKIRWGSAITFNAIANLQIVKTLSRSGCRLLFVGLESFNPAALADMHKHLNAIDKMRTAIDQCRDHGILIVSGLMISPTVDDGNYIRMIPKHLKESGLHVPSFICFECPIPGTPYFHRLASGATPQFLSNGLLRDFTGYTLVVKPKHETIDNLVDAYKWLLNEVYSKKTRLSKLVDDLRHFISNGHLLPSLIDLVNQSSAEPPLNQARTFLAGSDLPPPEATSVPLTEADFDSDTERRSIMAPWRVTDSDGCVLPEWLASTTIFESKGRVSTSALSLTATA